MKAQQTASTAGGQGWFAILLALMVFSASLVLWADARADSGFPEIRSSDTAPETTSVPGAEQ